MVDLLKSSARAKAQPILFPDVRLPILKESWRPDDDLPVFFIISLSEIPSASIKRGDILKCSKKSTPRAGDPIYCYGTASKDPSFLARYVAQGTQNFTIQCFGNRDRVRIPKQMCYFWKILGIVESEPSQKAFFWRWLGPGAGDSSSRSNVDQFLKRFQHPPTSQPHEPRLGMLTACLDIETRWRERKVLPFRLVEWANQ